LLVSLRGDMTGDLMASLIEFWRVAAECMPYWLRVLLDLFASAVAAPLLLWLL